MGDGWGQNGAQSVERGGYLRSCCRDLVNRHAIRHCAAQFPDRHQRQQSRLAGRRLRTNGTDGLDGDLKLLRNANAYANSYADGNFKPDSYANGNGNIYAYAYGYGNVYSNADSHGHVYAYRDSYGDIHANGNGHSDIHANSDSDCDIYRNGDSNCYSHSNGNSDRRAAVYTDATASADTAASSLAFFRN